jgi:hypothetical protein
MYAITLAHAAEPDTTDRQPPRETSCGAAPADQTRTREADRVFEARLRWFLALSRSA